MLKQVFSVLSIVCIGYFAAQAQDDDPVLFKVKDKEVRVSEFTYIYTKTNGSKADFSEKSLKEYLDLYVDFKLQVAKGVDMKLHESPEVIREQNQYKSQLSTTYLTDREITEKLVKEAYERGKEDRRFSHILIAVPKNASEEEKRDAYKRAQNVKSQVTAENFPELTKQFSDDRYSKDVGGDLGYFTALQLPYDLETAVYNTKKGAVSNIVSSKFGYHIVKVTDVRDAFGQRQIAHILIRPKKVKDPKTLIDSLHGALKNGAKFEEVVKANSHDNKTNQRGGRLGWVSINKYNKDFEEAIFELEKDGSISEPIKTSSGWHILKRLKSIEKPEYQDVKGELTNKIRRKPRFNIIQKALVDRIRKESDFKFDSKNKAALATAMSAEKDFMNFRWKVPAEQLKDQTTLFTVGNQKCTWGEFVSLAQRSHNERYTQNPKTVEAAIDRIMNILITQKCLAYEKTQLSKKYPEFKSLMREYEEGILLFEVKKQLVWDKASSDNDGLKAFYEANKNNYKWKPRADVTFYTIRTDDPKQLKKIRKKAKKKSPEDVAKMFNGDLEIVQHTSGSYEEGKNPEVDAIKWKKGSMNDGYSKDGSSYFTKIENVVPPSPKSLEEARGYVVADYQDSLEKDLIKELREEYKVEIVDAVFKSLIK
ncbi:MAG: peptidyl-prolyl cis-trans isomerase [Aureispira sp.]|nr:peptidyl-prolyl cis-trans isomerase [Aureispira sp.]